MTTVADPIAEVLATAGVKRIDGIARRAALSRRARDDGLVAGHIHCSHVTVS